MYFFPYGAYAPTPPTQDPTPVWLVALGVLILILLAVCVLIV